MRGKGWIMDVGNGVTCLPTNDPSSGSLTDARIMDTLYISPDCPCLKQYIPNPRPVILISMADMLCPVEISLFEVLWFGAMGGQLLVLCIRVLAPLLASMCLCFLHSTIHIRKGRRRGPDKGTD